MILKERIQRELPFPWRCVFLLQQGSPLYLHNVTVFEAAEEVEREGALLLYQRPLLLLKWHRIFAINCGLHLLSQLLRVTSATEDHVIVIDQKIKQL